MFTSTQEQQLRALISRSLDQAERHWRDGGYQLVAKATFDSAIFNEAMRSERSNIPGHQDVREGETVVDEFVAFVADMRDSTKHLMCEISSKTASVSTLKRVFYETSALLPAIALTVGFEEGSVTEYLGDGVLALFKVDKSKREAAIYSAHAAARNVVGPMRDVLNEILFERYKLPDIDLGVGLAFSKAIVSLIGLQSSRHPKVFGECVYRATKLSSGRNEIYVDTQVKCIWPTAKGGVIVFSKKNLNGVDGHLVERSA